MVLPLLAAAFVAQTDLTFVRHAETVANATGRYNTKTLNALSAKGEGQVRSLRDVLMKEPRFDLILVSPSPRALKTIAPYLRDSGQKATVWPLLYECCTERPRQAEAKSFGFGGRVEVPPAIARYFIVPTGAKLPAPRNFGEGLAQVTATEKEFRAKYTGRRILLVGHSAHGGQFLYRLTGKRLHVENAKPIYLNLKQ